MIDSCLLKIYSATRELDATTVAQYLKMFVHQVNKSFLNLLVQVYCGKNVKHPELLSSIVATLKAVKQVLELGLKLLGFRPSHYTIDSSLLGSRWDCTVKIALQERFHSWLSTRVQRNSAKYGTEPLGLSDIKKSSFFHHRWQLSFDIVWCCFKSIEELNCKE